MEIQNVKNGVIYGSYGSLRVTGNSAYELLLAFYSNFVIILHRF